MQAIDFLDKGAARFPERDVVHDGQSGIRYKDFQAMTHRIAHALRDSGIGTDSRVATYAPNHPLGYAAQFGVFRMGATWIPLNVRNGIEENIELLETLDVDWLFFHSSLDVDIARIASACPRIRGFVCVDGPSRAGESLVRWIEGKSSVFPEVRRLGDDVFAMLTTSGTTGRPKGVMLTHANFECMIASFNADMHFDAPPVHLVAAPLTHAAGMFASSMLAAGVTQLMLPKPDPGLILEWIERFEVTTLFLPPTLIYMLLAHPDVRRHDYRSLRYFVYGAAPMSSDKLREASAVFGHVFFQIFGQTEALMIVTSMTPRDHEEALTDPAKSARLVSCGRPSPYVEVGVMDEQGRLVPNGDAGEIVVRGNIVMKGYYKNLAGTAEVSTFGWHHTGDIGKFDDDGFVYLVDRKKDMIISGGFNVYPNEVEQVIWNHPSILDCAVVGIPDEKWGESVTAIVELKAGATLDAAELIAFCKQHLGSVKAPKTIHVWPALPRSSIGKVLKREIRQRFWEGRSRAI